MAFSNFRRGLDARDCRLDIAFILGDDAVPDDVTLEDRYRDRTCVWLDLVDIQYDQCVVTEADKKEYKTIYDIGLVSNKTKAEEALREALRTTYSDRTNTDTIVIKPETLVTEASNKTVNVKEQTQGLGSICIQEVSTIADKKENKIVITQAPRKTTKTLKIENTTVEKPEEEENNTCY